jgi:thiamine pyrophosphate-dependent acetolactate synthase large subunit-like protein
VVRFLEQCGTRAAFGVISIHNMPMLDAFHTRGQIRFVSARGEAGACNMADAYARVTGTLGACVTSTGTGAGNAAGALVEAVTAGTPMLHLTGQIESPYLDRDLGYIHEHPAQLAMLKAVGKDAFRIRNPATALATLREAARLAQTPPCGPVSIEIPIDVQKMLLDLPDDIAPLARGAGAAVRGSPGCAGRQAAAGEAPAAVAGRRRARCIRCGAPAGQHGLGRRHLGAGPGHRARGPSAEPGLVQPAKAGRGLLRDGATRCWWWDRACAATRR